jgi:hypothetical protein
MSCSGLARACICNKSCNFVFKYLIEKFIICRILNASKQLWMLGVCTVSFFLYQDMHRWKGVRWCNSVSQLCAYMQTFKF